MPFSEKQIYHLWEFVTFLFQKPANILVMGEGPERGRVKIGKKAVLATYHFNITIGLLY